MPMQFVCNLITMEVTESPSTSKNSCQIEPGDMEIVSNWKIVNEKLLHNTISTVDVNSSPGRADLEDVVSLETCIRLEGNVNEKREPCSITVALKNGQKIARIAIVSEAFLIEIYKQFGEYVSTAHAEFIDEFEQSAVYFADVRLLPPTPEVTIKFARTKNLGTPMWLYGIRLSLTEASPNDKANQQFDYNVIGNFLQTKSRAESKPVNWAMKILERTESDQENHGANELDSFLRDFMSVNIDPSKNSSFAIGDESKKLVCKKDDPVEMIGDSKAIRDSDFKTYIDDRLGEMEERLTKRIETMNFQTNEKLDSIIKLLSNKSN